MKVIPAHVIRYPGTTTTSAVRNIRLMPLSGGQTFAGFRILRLLGSGGMGEVYLAEHPRLPRRNALKVLPADVSADPAYRAASSARLILPQNSGTPSS